MERARMQGYPVLGAYDTLRRLVDEGGVDLVVITQVIDRERLADLRTRCAERRVALERLNVVLDPLV